MLSPARKSSLLMALLLFFPVRMALAQSSFPPLAPGQGRIVLYRPYHFLGGASGNLIALNGQFVGILRAGKYFYVDQAPGNYYVRAYWLVWGSLTRGSSQDVSLRAGNTIYLKLNSDYNVMNTAPAEQAAKDLRHMHFDTAATKDKDKQSPQHMATAREDFENFKQSSGFAFEPTQQSAAQSSAPAETSQAPTPQPAPNSNPQSLFGSMRSSNQPAAQSNPVLGSSQTGAENGTQQSPQTTAQSAALTETSQSPTPQPAPNSKHHSLFGSMRSSSQPASQSNPVFSSGQTGAENGTQQPPQPTAKIQAIAGNVVLFVTVNQRCEKDHDPFGLMPGVGMHLLSKCGANELNHLRETIDQGLKNRNVAVTEANQQGSVQLAVTLTRSRWDGLNEFARGKIRFAATYQLSSAGTAPPVNVEYEESGLDKHAEERFGDKIAADVASKIAAMTPTAPAVGNQVNSPGNGVAVANLFEIVAQAYRSLAVKPPWSDTTRAQNRKAEDLMAAGDFKQAAAVYRAILQTNHWWPEGYRGLSLALQQTGDLPRAILWMRRYLEFEPNAPDAVEMRTKLDTWTHQVPPQPPPQNLAPEPGLHLGAVILDTPGIVAMALGQPDLDGAMIVDVLPGSIAENAGLQKGDIVLSYNGTPVHSAMDLLALVAKVQPGSEVRLAIQRGTTRSTVSVVFQQPQSK